MADVTELRPSYGMSPVLAGFLGAGLLVLVVLVLVLLWSFCQRRYASSQYKLHADRYCDAEDPPYRFIHMLKGISIYPETLSGSKRVSVCPEPGGGSKRIVRSVRRDTERRGRVHADNSLLDGLVDGQLQMGHLAPPSDPSGSSLEYQSESSPESGSDLGCESGLVSGPVSGPVPGPALSLGSLSLTVDYNFPKKALVVTVVGARGLPAVSQGSADPYVKLTILPEKKHRVKTRVLRQTLHPLFDETFSFYGVSYSALPDLTLHFQVLSFDRFARHDVIGEALVPLRGVDPSTGRVHLTQDISRRTAQACGSGELLASLCYQPVSHRLSVVVLKARNLPKINPSLSANPYVKVNVFYGRKRIAKKKTHVKKGTLNPVYNESFIYDIPPDLLPQISLELLVLDFDRTTKNQVLGRLQLGLCSPSATGAAHWSQLCQSPRRQISKWHSLDQV